MQLPAEPRMPGLKLRVIFEPCEWKSVYMAVRRQPPKTPPTLNEMVKMIASLGGYVIRKSTNPGTQTLWFGCKGSTICRWAGHFGPDVPRQKIRQLWNDRCSGQAANHRLKVGWGHVTARACSGQAASHRGVQFHPPASWRITTELASVACCLTATSNHNKQVDRARDIAAVGMVRGRKLPALHRYGQAASHRRKVECGCARAQCA